MSRIQTVSGPDRTVVRFVDEPNELLNHVLEASEEADHARTAYRGFFTQSFVVVAITAVQLALGVEAGLILRGVLLAFVLSAGLYRLRLHFVLKRYRYLRNEWFEVAKGDSTWEESK